MTTRPCDPMCPFLGCASCEYAGGEIPAAATVSDAVSGVASGKIEASSQACETPAKARTDRGRGPTFKESNVNDRTPKPPPLAAL